MMNSLNGKIADWVPPEKLKNAVYVVDKIGMLALVVLFLLGQNAGWVPSMAQADHRGIDNKIVTLSARVDDNGVRITNTELASLRTQQIALQICVQLYPKEDQYKCLKPYEK